VRFRAALSGLQTQAPGAYDFFLRGSVSWRVETTLYANQGFNLMSLESKIRTYIIDQLQKKGALPENIDPGQYRYLDARHIDSMGMLKFILNIENEFDIELETNDTQAEEFQTIDGVVRIIKQKLQIDKD
jgi:acyl carrier protein